MKRFWQKNKDSLQFICIVFLIWRVYLYVLEYLSKIFFPLHTGFLGPIPWANMDGSHYLVIATQGYLQFLQAFFPLFPLLIFFVGTVLFHHYLLAAMLIVHLSLFFALFFFWKILEKDFSPEVTKWAIVLLLFSPVGFFLGSVYTESLFLLFTFAALYCIRTQKFIWGALCIALASATRLIGIFLILILIYNFWIHYPTWEKRKKHLKEISISLLLSISGLIAYMVYLWIAFGDPLLFMHVQPAFGAGRTGGKIILLPQVLWRYVRIFLTIPLSHLDFWIALLEIATLFSVLVILYLSYLRKIRIGYILFSLVVLLIPTLSGTLSSLPRYALASFASFIYLATLPKSIKYTILSVCIVLETILAMLYLRGYFVS